MAPGKIMSQGKEEARTNLEFAEKPHEIRDTLPQPAQGIDLDTQGYTHGSTNNVKTGRIV
jgi:hypothetical protein